MWKFAILPKNGGRYKVFLNDTIFGTTSIIRHIANIGISKNGDQKF